jgi:outer membrane receptor protein involved in Fe transport
VVTGDWSHPLEGGRSLYANATVTYRSRDHGRTPFLDPASVSYDPARVNADAYTLVNLRLGLKVSDLDLSLFAKNLLNDDARLARNHDQVKTTLFRDTSLRPRTVGLTATYRY